MSVRHATWKNGQVVLDGTADWPEGEQLVVQEAARPMPTFMTEEEQSDDPEAVEAWIAHLESLPPLLGDPRDDPEYVAWQQKMRQFNLEAMKAKFAEELP